MNFLAIKKAAFRRLQASETQTSTLNSEIGGYVNRWHRQLLSQPTLRPYRSTQITVATVADQWRYGVPLRAINHITERSNERRLGKKSEGWWRRRFPDPSTETGDAEVWVPLGSTPLLRRPADASELFVISTSGSDTGMTAHVEGVRSDGVPVAMSVQLTGLTGVTLNSAETTIVDVTKFFLTAVGVGTIELREDSGVGALLSTIRIGETYPRYLAIALAPTPSAVQTLYVDGTPRTFDLSVDQDEPFIPEDYHDLLVDGAVYDYWLNHGRLKDAQWLRDEIDRVTKALNLTHWMDVHQDEAGEGSGLRSDDERTLSLPLT